MTAIDSLLRRLATFNGHLLVMAPSLDSAHGPKALGPKAEQFDGRDAQLLENALAGVTAMRTALRAWKSYEAAIEMCGNEPQAMASFCTAQGDTLDSLWAAAVSATNAALAGSDDQEQSEEKAPMPGP